MDRYEQSRIIEMKTNRYNLYHYLFIFLVALTACQSLLTTGKILARPALTVLVSQLVQDSSDWATVIHIVDTVLDAALRSAPPPTPEQIEERIGQIVGSYAPGTESQRDQFLSEVQKTLQEDAAVSSRYPPVSTQLQVLQKSIAEGLQSK